MMSIQSIYFQGLKFSIFNDEEIENYIIEVINNKSNIICYGYSIGILPTIKSFPEILYNANTFDLMVTDGRPLYLLMKIFGAPIKSNISIPELVLKVLDICNKYSLSIFLLGSKEATNLKAITNIKVKYKNIKSVHGFHGFWEISEEHKIIEILKQKSPNVLLIALPSPYKESLASKIKKYSVANIIIPCGGMVDVIADEFKLTPTFIKKIGFAWLFRLIQQPKRIKLTVKFLIAFFIILLKLIINKLINSKKSAFLQYLNLE